MSKGNKETLKGNKGGDDGDKVKNEFKVPVLPPAQFVAKKTQKPNSQQSTGDANTNAKASEVNDEKRPEIEKPSTDNTANEIKKPCEDSAESVKTTKPKYVMKPGVCPYKEPIWSATPPTDMDYKFEVLKSGQIIETVGPLQDKPVWTFGRDVNNDVNMAHISISRFHLVLQYCPKMIKNTDEDNDSDDEIDSTVARQPDQEGWYIYDLGSTHGTLLNKMPVPPKVYVRIRVGHILRLGGSSRHFILQGPNEDAEPESEFTITELREQRLRREAEAAAEKERLKKEAEEKEKKEGISWGMAEDADETTDLTHNPYASTNNENLFFDDPKKTLRGYFEREGQELEYKCNELSAGSFVCRVELPIDDSVGRPIIAEVTHKGRKKDCVVQCALEACRILDRQGVLRQSNQEPLKRKVKKDSSDSDDDGYLDRTGDVERRKERKVSLGPKHSLTHESLIKQAAELEATLAEIEKSIKDYQEAKERLKMAKSQRENSDDLDTFMESLSDDPLHLDSTKYRKMRWEQKRLKVELAKTRRLVTITKSVPLLAPSGKSASTGDDTTTEADQAAAAKKKLPLIGKRNQFSRFTVTKLPNVSIIPKAFASDEEEEDVPEKEEMQTKKRTEKKEVVNRNEKSVKIIKTVDEKKISANKEVEPADKEEKSDNNMKRQTRRSSPRLANISGEVPQKNVKAKEEKPAVKVLANEDRLPKYLDKIDEVSESAADAEHEEAAKQSATRKRRQRQRQRGKRQDVDIDDEDYESTEKYAKWLPPDNQTGDGFTKLNAKYGY